MADTAVTGAAGAATAGAADLAAGGMGFEDFPCPDPGLHRAHGARGDWPLASQRPAWPSGLVGHLAPPNRRERPHIGAVQSRTPLIVHARLLRRCGRHTRPIALARLGAATTQRTSTCLPAAHTRCREVAVLAIGIAGRDETKPPTRPPGARKSRSRLRRRKAAADGIPLSGSVRRGCAPIALCLRRVPPSDGGAVRRSEGGHLANQVLL